MRGDVVLALSASGETEEILQLLATIKRLQVPLITMTCDEIARADAGGGARATRASTLASSAEVALDCSISKVAFKPTLGSCSRHSNSSIQTFEPIFFSCTIAVGSSRTQPIHGSISPVMCHPLYGRIPMQQKPWQQGWGSSPIWLSVRI